MLRLILLLMLTGTVFSLPAQAFSKTGTFGDMLCWGKHSDKMCIRNETRWVVSGDSTIEVRNIDRKGYSERELKRIFESQGVDWAEFDKQTFVPGVTPRKNYNDPKQRRARYVLRGLVTADGKTELLPAHYKSVYPLSNQVAIVKTIDGEWRLATLGTEPDLRRVPMTWKRFESRFGNDASTPLTFILENWGRKYFLLGPEGQVLTTIENAIKPDADSDMPKYFAFDGGLIGFPVLTEEGIEASVFVDPRTGAIDRIGDPLVFVKAKNGADYYATCGNGMSSIDGTQKRTYWQAMVRVGSLPASTEFGDRSIYMPLGDDGYPVRQTGDRRFVGMSAVSPGSSVSTIWAFVYLDQGRFSYKVVGNATPDLVSDRRWAGFAARKVSMPPKLDDVADIWAGSLDDKDVQEMAGETSIFSAGAHFAVRLYKSTEQGAAGGLTPWIGVRVCDSNAVTEQFMDTTWLYSETATSDNPRIAATMAAAQTQLKSKQRRDAIWAGGAAAIEARQRSEQLARVTYAQESMRLGRSAKNDIKFFGAARFEGGAMLAYYWRDNGRLPGIEDASEICGRFGGASPECRLVGPWAQGIYAEQDAARNREAERYAAQQQYERDRYQSAISKPAYKPADKHEIEYCWRENGFWNC